MKYIPELFIEQLAKDDGRNPAGYLQELSRKGYGKVLVCAFSNESDDSAKDANITYLRDLIRNTDIPVIGTGYCKRLEDVKKLLYAGCDAVCVNIISKSDINILEEASQRFSKDKIYAKVDDKGLYEACKDIILEYAGVIITSVIITKNGADDLMLYDMICNDCISKYGNADNVYLQISEDEIEKYKSDIELNCKYKWSDLKKNLDGHVPVVVQDYKTDQVLMVAYMNEEAFDITVKTGIMTYFSRSRNELWIKGETSGHYQYVKAMYVDCDNDTILVKVHQIGNACHTGSYSCFFNEAFKLNNKSYNPEKVLNDVYNVILDRKANPKEGSYTNYLFDKGVDKILKKVGEEATEIVIAAKNPDNEEIKYEIADFLYHIMVLMAEKDVSWEDITKELANR